MHNLSISCAMVCVILLASAALLGTFGIIKRQISAVLITGVMYILAGNPTQDQLTRSDYNACEISMS